MPTSGYRYTLPGFVSTAEGSSQENTTNETATSSDTSNQMARQLEALRRYNMADRVIPPFTLMEEYVDTDATSPERPVTDMLGQVVGNPPGEPARDLASLLPRGMRMRPRRERQPEYTMYPVQVAKSAADEESEAFAKFFVRVKCVEVPFDFEPVEKIPEELEALAKKLREQWVSAVKEWTDKKYESMPI